MPVTRGQLIVVLAVTALYFIAQLLVGTDLVVATLFAVAILFGALSIFAGGGLASAFGCLNAILISKFLLFGIALKVLFLIPADDTLMAGPTTAFVMAMGFMGLFLGTAIQAHIPCPRFLSMNRALSDNMLLSLSVVLFLTSYAAYFASLIPGARGESFQSGGWLGIARSFAPFMSLSIIPPMFYLWRIQTKRWMTHPVILGLLTWSSLVGIFNTGKQDAMQPLVFYVLVGFLRYGWRDLRLWSLLAAGASYYAMIVFPYSQYVRDNGGRQGTFEQRAEVTKTTFLRIAGDQAFRTSVSDRVSKGSYFSSGPLASFDRLAMVGEADRLIAVTERERSFTGWETIIWGFKLGTPSFLYKDKPPFEAANYLGHIVGDVNHADMMTMVSYGFMANLYNAFSFTGVFLGTLIFFAAFYYWTRIFIGTAKWENLPTASTLCFLWFVASYHHNVVESSLSGIIASLWLPVILGLLYIISRGLSVFLPGNGCGCDA
jgi:hypothetical protein